MHSLTRLVALFPRPRCRLPRLSRTASSFYNDKFHKGKRSRQNVYRLLHAGVQLIIMKARQILDRKKLCCYSMHVIGCRDVGRGDFEPHVEEICFAAFPKQIFAWSKTATKIVKTQSIFVLQPQNFAQRRNKNHRLNRVGESTNFL